MQRAFAVCDYVPGEHFQYRSVNIWPRPYQQPHPPVWSTSSSVGSSRALGARGHVVATVMTGYRAKTVFDEYRKGWKDAGRPLPTPLDRFAYMGFVAVGGSETGMGNVRVESSARRWCTGFQFRVDACPS